MTKEEEIIEEIGGRQNPFKVPEGYFAELQANIMNQISAEDATTIKPKARRRYLWPIISAAAVVCLIVVGATLFFNSEADQMKAKQTAMVAPTEVQANSIADDTEFCDMLLADVEAADDYIMMSTEDMYQYIAEYY